MKIQYIEDPLTGTIIKQSADYFISDDWLHSQGPGGFKYYEFDINSPKHTLFLLKYSDHIVQIYI